MTKILPMLLNHLLRLPPVRLLDRIFWRARGRLGPGRFRGRRGLRLHLGCGLERMRGFINIDRDPEARADLRLDIRELHRAFDPGSVSAIVMVHSLGYLRLWEARDLFRRCLALLEPGGTLAVETPDLEKCAARLLATGAVPGPEYLEGVRGFYGFGRDDLAARRAWVPYAFGWSGPHLRRELEDAGFTDVRVLEPRTHVPWRDMRVEARRPHGGA